jgi:hypothetical protein
LSPEEQRAMEAFIGLEGAFLRETYNTDVPSLRAVDAKRT